jgi:hypothetical protein
VGGGVSRGDSMNRHDTPARGLPRALGPRNDGIGARCQNHRHCEARSAVAIHETVQPLEAPGQAARLSGLPRFARNDEGLGDWRGSLKHCDTANTRHCEARSAVAIHPTHPARSAANAPCSTY